MVFFVAFGVEVIDVVKYFSNSRHWRFSVGSIAAAAVVVAVVGDCIVAYSVGCWTWVFVDYIYFVVEIVVVVVVVVGKVSCLGSLYSFH